MEVSSIDMPGLLSVIANVIAEKNINLTHAKISTLGEKINDIFYLTTPQGAAITDQTTLDVLAQDLVLALESKKVA
jgi:[protein-PII] uridylyltransferase